MRRAHRSVHLRAWLVLAVALPVAVGLAIVLGGGGVPAEPGVDAIRAAGGLD